MIIHVLGLGETLEDFIPDGNITIGVNDIHQYHKTNFVVCVDRAGAFPDKKRLNAIRNTKCEGFYSCIDEWKQIPNFRKIELLSPRGSSDRLDEDGFCYSNSSPFVACVLAYKMGAKKIVLWGVDLMSHPNIIDHKRERALKDFRELKKNLNLRGVELLVGDDFSYLSTFLQVYAPENM